MSSEPVSAPLSPTLIAWIESAMGSGARVAHVEALASSSTIQHRIDLVLGDGSARRVVLRRYQDGQRLARDPWYVPAHEARALTLLTGSGVPAPRLYAADLEAACGDGPALLVSWIPGAPAWRPDDLESYLARAAEVLVAIHAVPVPLATRLPRYAPYREQEPIVSPPFSARAGLWEQVAEILARARPTSRETFIHRDYHPGNVLWDGSTVTGVVDWTTAATGPPGIDLARMRLNLAAHLGPAAADGFVTAYVAAGGDPSARHPLWDLLDAADLLLDLDSESLGRGDLARLEDYVASVVAEWGERDSAR